MQTFYAPRELVNDRSVRGAEGCRDGGPKAASGLVVRIVEVDFFS